MPKKIKENINQDTDEELETEDPTTEIEKTTDDIFEQAGELVVDVFETKEDFVVSAAIAGVQIKDLDISLEKDMMVIKGNRCDPNLKAEKKYFYQECFWGPFYRKVVLPENVDVDNADAQIDKGILTIKIPKNEKNGDTGKIGIKVS